MVAWRDNTWLATLTVMRNKQQGDFCDEEMQELQALQSHFACIIRRLAGHQESRLIHSSLRHFVASLPTAKLILDWNLKVSALQFDCKSSLHPVEDWISHSPPSRPPVEFRSRVISWPSSNRCVRAIISQNGENLAAGNRAFHLHHSSLPSLSAWIEFLPSRSLLAFEGNLSGALKEEHSAHRQY